MARIANPVLDIVEEQYSDTFFIVEYTGHPLSTMPNRLETVSFQNGSYVQPKGKAKPGVTDDVSEGYDYFDLPFNSKGANELFSTKLIKDIVTKEILKHTAAVATFQSTGEYPKQIIPSFLPGDVGRKITSVGVDVTATTEVPQANIVFRGITVDNLRIDEAFGFTWHNRGAGFRIWCGNRSLTDHINGIDKDKIFVLFEGFVNAADYDYGEEGITLTLSLNNHKSVFLRQPLKQRLWEECNSAYALIKSIGRYLGILPDNVVVQFNFSEENKKIKDELERLYGVQSKGNRADIIAFYEENIKKKIALHLAEKPNDYPTPADLLNILAFAYGVDLRWHLTTDAVLFFGLPQNPNIYSLETTPDIFVKKFVYREAQTSPFKSLDIFKTDYYSEIRILDFEKVERPEEPSQALNVMSGTINEPENEPTSSITIAEGTETSGIESYYKLVVNNSPTGEVRDLSSTTKVQSGRIYIQPKDLQKLQEESHTYGNVGIEITGCMIDPRVSPMMYIYFKGYKDHTGSYLITNVNYSWDDGKPTMTIRGIKPLSVADFKKISPKLQVNSLMAIKEADAGGGTNSTHVAEGTETSGIESYFKLTVTEETE